MISKTFEFSILHKSKKSSARRGRITTPHGVIETPAFVTVGTKGTVKSLTPEDLALTGTQFVFCNTYHLVLSPGVDVLKKAGGIHAYSKINEPIITDSGGFQVFSLGGNRKLTINNSNDDSKQKSTLVSISDEGVRFKSHTNGDEYFFTPEFSIQSQVAIGADFVVSFDENIYYGATEGYTKRSLARTQDWAKRSLNEFHVTRDTFHKSKQQIYGVIQGGMYKDLHVNSAKKISALPFFGLAIGGVSVGMSKSEIRENVSWTLDVIDSDSRPRHLLGIGHIDDIVDMVKMGVDTFNCVTPTRDARVGKLYIKNGILDVMLTKYKADLSPIDPMCGCYTCKTFTRSYLHHLFKQRELLAYRLATIHNLFFMEEYFKKIREKNETGKL